MTAGYWWGHVTSVHAKCMLLCVCVSYHLAWCQYSTALDIGWSVGAAACCSPVEVLM